MVFLDAGLDPGGHIQPSAVYGAPGYVGYGNNSMKFTVQAEAVKVLHPAVGVAETEFGAGHFDPAGLFLGSHSVVAFSMRRAALIAFIARAFRTPRAFCTLHLAAAISLPVSVEGRG